MAGVGVRREVDPFASYHRILRRRRSTALLASAVALVVVVGGVAAVTMASPRPNAIASTGTPGPPSAGPAADQSLVGEPVPSTAIPSAEASPAIQEPESKVQAPTVTEGSVAQALGPTPRPLILGFTALTSTGQQINVSVGDCVTRNPVGVAEVALNSYIVPCDTSGAELVTAFITLPDPIPSAEILNRIVFDACFAQIGWYTVVRDGQASRSNVETGNVNSGGSIGQPARWWSVTAGTRLFAARRDDGGTVECSSGALVAEGDQPIR